MPTSSAHFTDASRLPFTGKLPTQPRPNHSQVLLASWVGGVFAPRPIYISCYTLLAKVTLDYLVDMVVVSDGTCVICSNGKRENSTRRQS